MWLVVSILFTFSFVYAVYAQDIAQEGCVLMVSTSPDGTQTLSCATQARVDVSESFSSAGAISMSVNLTSRSATSIPILLNRSQVIVIVSDIVANIPSDALITSQKALKKIVLTSPQNIYSLPITVESQTALPAIESGLMYDATQVSTNAFLSDYEFHFMVNKDWYTSNNLDMNSTFVLVNTGENWEIVESTYFFDTNSVRVKATYPAQRMMVVAIGARSLPQEEKPYQAPAVQISASTKPKMPIGRLAILGIVGLIIFSLVCVLVWKTIVNSLSKKTQENDSDLRHKHPDLYNHVLNSKTYGFNKELTLANIENKALSKGWSKEIARKIVDEVFK
ncbi:MAG TPA: hypothetical protein VK158_06055 [Acidobacteriota bacterium]|nr:hypothetical protein [Acidobacteriota bacterium]